MATRKRFVEKRKKFYLPIDKKVKKPYNGITNDGNFSRPESRKGEKAMTTSWTIIMWATDSDAEYERFTSNDYHEVYEMCKAYTRIHQGNGRFKFYIRANNQ